MVNRAGIKRFARITGGAAFIVFVGGAELACRSATEITFVISTDEPCTSVQGTAISVGVLGAALDAKPPATTSMFCDPQTHSLGSLVVVPSGDKDAELGVRIVTGTTSSTDQCIQNNFTGGCIVARRAIHFIPHSPITVPVEMDSACVGQVCDPNSTCFKGSCVPVAVDCLEGSCDGGSSTTTSVGSGSWKTISASPLKGRVFSANLAFGTSLFVWGGYGANIFYSDGAYYRPETDSWLPLPTNQLAARGFAVAAQNLVTSDIIIWGGADNTQAFSDGAVYSLASNNWTPVSASAPIVAREKAVAVATNDTAEMIIWGGDDGKPTPTLFSDGAAYNSQTKTWRKLKASPLAARSDASAIYSGGSAMVVYGGNCGTAGICPDYAIYRPSNDTWYGPYQLPSFSARAYPAAGEEGTTSDVLFFGGGNGEAVFDDGIAITPNNQSTRPIPSPGSVLTPPGRRQMAGWTNVDVLYVWGGNNGTTDYGNGAAYDSAAGTWTAMSTVNAPSARSFPAFGFSNNKAIVWGGQTGVSPNVTYKNDGAIFTP